MLNIDPWNMVMIVINLLVLYAIFRKFLYKPVMNVIHQREELIQGQFDSAKKTQDDALALKADYEEKLEQANVKADQIILAARDQAKEEKEAIQKQLESIYPDEKVVLSEETDASLLGGYVVRVGYEEYDHSYEGKLRRLERKLTGR